jgi:hypothetical protein
MKTRHSDKRGYALVTVLMLMTVVMVILTIVLTQSGDSLGAAGAQRRFLIARARASMGAKRAMAEMKNPSTYTAYENIATLQYCKIPVATGLCSAAAISLDPTGCPCTQDFLNANPTGCAGYAVATPCIIPISESSGTALPGGLVEAPTVDVNNGGGLIFRSYVVNVGKCKNPVTAPLAPYPDCPGVGRFVIFSTGYWGRDAEAIESKALIELSISAPIDPTPPTGYDGTG